MPAHAKTGSGSPVGSVTPAYRGQHYIDTSSNGVYQAYGTTNADWVSLILNGGVSSSFAFLTENLEITTSRAAGAETIALKTSAGTDPSASDKIRIGFRDVTAGTGAYSIIDITAATSIVISSGSTLGASNSTAFRLWLVGFNDGGTFRLGVIKCALTDGIYGLQDNVIASSTAEGGAGAADSSGVFYTGTAVTSKVVRVLGYLEYTLAAVGTWDTAPSIIQIYSHGDRLPGVTVQKRIKRDGAYASGTTVLPSDNTIPQNTEGVQFLSQAITPKSAINVLEINANLQIENSANNNMGMALFQDSTANALAAMTWNNGAAGARDSVYLSYSMAAGTTSSTTFNIRAGGSAAGTTSFNSAGAAAAMGGVMASFLEIVEVMV